MKKDEDLVRDVGKTSCPPGTKRGYDDGGQDSMKRPRYDDDAALGPDGKRVHTDVSGAIPGSETVYRLLVPAKKVSMIPVIPLLLCSPAFFCKASLLDDTSRPRNYSVCA